MVKRKLVGNRYNIEFCGFYMLKIDLLQYLGR